MHWKRCVPAHWVRGQTASRNHGSLIGCWDNGGVRLSLHWKPKMTSVERRGAQGFDECDVELTISGIRVRGMEIDASTGCAHYRSELDIIAVKFNCCRTFYSCFYCHELEADHPARIWPQAQFDEKAVLCGACGAELTIRQYLNYQAACPSCGARFNPRCALHHHLYFETSGPPVG
jgi:uncharacterized CHY-type Zn-finger protein